MRATSNIDHTVTVDGLADLMAWAKDANKDLQRAMRKELKEAVGTVVQAAKGHAASIMDDGTYRDSIKQSVRANGSAYYIRSNDPAAAVKEFARPGAHRRARSSSIRSAISRGYTTPEFHGLPRVGVPKGNPPRAIVKARDEKEQEVVQAFEDAVNSVLDKAGGING